MARPLWRTMFVSTLAALAALLSTLPGEAREAGQKQICLTFEKLPYMKPLGYWRPREVSNMILRSLEKHGIKAAGFVSEERIDADPGSLVVLEDWAQQGHILGNQTYADVDLHQLSADDFLSHVADGQKYLRRMAGRFRFNFRYFRYPLLHEGEDLRKKRAVRRALTRGGYEIAPVTVKTSSHAFNRPYLAVEYEPEKVALLRQVFLDHVAESLDYAEAQSQLLFQRNITHVLQLHGGIATAAFLDSLIEMLKSRGYSFIDLPQALEEEAFQTEETYAGPLGLPFIDRVAATQEQPFDENKGQLEYFEVERVFRELLR